MSCLRQLNFKTPPQLLIAFEGCLRKLNSSDSSLRPLVLLPRAWRAVTAKATSRRGGALRVMNPRDVTRQADAELHPPQKKREKENVKKKKSPEGAALPGWSAACNPSHLKLKKKRYFTTATCCPCGEKRQGIVRFPPSAGFPRPFGVGA